MTKKIRQRFQELKEKHPTWGSVPLLIMSLKKSDGRRQIRKSFNELVPKEDYGEGEKDAILEDIYSRVLQDAN